MGATLIMAFALMLIIEGALPVLAPSVWRETFRRIMLLTDGQIRFVGLAAMALGLLLFVLVS